MTVRQSRTLFALVCVGVLNSTMTFAQPINSGVVPDIEWESVTVTDPISGAPMQFEQPLLDKPFPVEWWSESYFSQSLKGKIFLPGLNKRLDWFADDRFIWFNKETGYIAFLPDYCNLDTRDVDKIKDKLTMYYDPAHPPVTRLEKLKWLEVIYRFRFNRQQFFWTFNYKMLREFRHEESERVEYAEKLIIINKDAERMFRRFQRHGDSLLSEIAPRWETVLLLSMMGRNRDAEVEYRRLRKDIDKVEKPAAYRQVMLEQMSQYEHSFPGSMAIGLELMQGKPFPVYEWWK